MGGHSFKNWFWIIRELLLKCWYDNKRGFLYVDILFHYYSVLLGSDQLINEFQEVNQDLIWKLQDKFLSLVNTLPFRLICSSVTGKEFILILQALKIYTEYKVTVLILTTDALWDLQTIIWLKIFVS